MNYIEEKRKKGYEIETYDDIWADSKELKKRNG